MNFNDRIEFAKKMVEIATALGRTIDEEDVDVFFNQLDEHPIKDVIKGADQALRDRDPNDEYLQKMMLTVPEIRAAIDRMEEAPPDELGSVESCQICRGGGWITGMGEGGRMIAWPCECLYNAAKKALRKKRRHDHLDYMRARIIKIYEGHQKRWGVAEEEK